MKGVAAVLGACVVLPALAAFGLVGTVAAVVGAGAPGGVPTLVSGSPGGLLSASAPSTIPGIPAGYLADFVASGFRFGVPWEVLAGIYRVECDFGQSLLAGCNPVGSENPFGAQGPGQFLPSTWRVGLGPHQVILPGPPTTNDAAGYATDGDGDGIADVWDPADAVASTARLLAANGAARDLSGAIFAYNHDPAYVAEVLRLAGSYGQAQARTVAAGPAGGIVVDWALAQVGTPYLWGGETPGVGFDCSGLVQAAYKVAGITLPRVAQDQWDAGPQLPPGAPLGPGDLVFFGGSASTVGHVGIFVGIQSGRAMMVDAPYTGADVRVEPFPATLGARWGSDIYVGATRPVR